jgi:hypothetical protein
MSILSLFAQRTICSNHVTRTTDHIQPSSVSGNIVFYLKKHALFLAPSLTHQVGLHALDVMEGLFANFYNVRSTCPDDHLLGPWSVQSFNILLSPGQEPTFAPNLVPSQASPKLDLLPQRSVSFDTHRDVRLFMIGNTVSEHENFTQFLSQFLSV